MVKCKSAVMVSEAANPQEQTAKEVKEKMATAIVIRPAAKITTTVKQSASKSKKKRKRMVIGEKTHNMQPE